MNWEERGTIDRDASVHPNAQIHPGAVVRAGSYVASGAILEDGAVAGIRSQIHKAAVLRQNAVIGTDSTIGAGAVVGPGATIGRNSRIGPEAAIAAGATIEAYTIIKQGATVTATDSTRRATTAPAEEQTLGENMKGRPNETSDYTRIDWEDCPAVERTTNIMNGAWCFEGTRLAVSSLFANLADGMTIEEYTETFPAAREEQITAVLAFQAQRLTPILDENGETHRTWPPQNEKEERQTATG